MDRVLELEAGRRNHRPSRDGWLGRVRPAWAAVAVALVLLAAAGLRFAGTGAPAGIGTLAEAAQFAKGVKTMHIVANMRTIPIDNFDYLDLKAPLITVNIWKQSGDQSRWRVEKSGRVVAMDGSFTTLLINGEIGPVAAKHRGSATGMVGWLAPLLDVGNLFDHERQQAASEGSTISVGREASRDGTPKTVLTVRAKAQGDFSESDYTKNKIIWESDNVRVYTFDSATQKLEGIRIYVETAKGKVLAFETTRIDYDQPTAPSTFALDVPKGATWLKQPSELPAARDTSQMTPEEVARAFFEACSRSDWDEARVFFGTTSDNAKVREYLGGLKVISIGESFRSGLYPGRFVPYKIQLKSGEVRKHNLAVRNDNPKHLWSVDGGI